MRRSSLVYFAWCLTGLVVPLPAQRPDSVSSVTVAAGVVHRHLVLGDGPWNVNVLEVDLRQPGISIQAARAADRVRGRESVSAMARRKSTGNETVLAAINADFFNLTTGEDDNNQVIEGEIWKGVAGAATRADGMRPIHAQFGIAGNGRPLIDAFAFRGTILRSHGERLPLDGINNRSSPRDVVLYTARFGPMTPWDSTGTTLDVKLRYVASRGDTSVYQVASFPVSAGTAFLTDGPVLSVPAALDSARNLPRPGELIRVQTNLSPAPIGLRTVVGGRPRLVVHGQSIADTVGRLAGTFTRAFIDRNPRTGVGFSRDSTTFYLITVDGRQASSLGMSLAEFASLMIQLGVYEGLNLDGGGSTTMVIGGRIVNRPSDKEGERPVGNALLVMQANHE